MYNEIRTCKLCGSKGITFISKAKTDGGWACRSIGFYRASPHSYGGASYAVTHSQRKYLSHSHILANSPAIGCIRRWWYRSAAGPSPPYRLTIMAHPPPGFMQTERICLPYSFVESLSAHRNTPLPVCFCERKSFGGTERPPLPSALVLNKRNHHVDELTVGGSLLQLHPGHIV